MSSRVHVVSPLRLAVLSSLAILTPFLSGRAAAQQTFTGGGAISVSGSQTTAGSSTLTVSGATGTSITSVMVTINGVTSNGSGDGLSMAVADFVLKAPGGQQLVLLGATGDSSDNGGLNGATIMLKDGNSAAPNGSAWTPANGTFMVEPSSYWMNSQGIPPPFGASTDWPQSDGTGTLNGRFNGAAPDGGWTLSIQNFEATSAISITSWSLTFTYAAGTNSPTSTSLSSSANPSIAGNNVTYTATVTSSGFTPTGTVTFTNTTTSTTLCSAALLSGGQAQCNSTMASQGLFNIAASYTPAGSFDPSSTSLNQLVEGTPTQSGNQWCNTASLSIPQNQTPTVYPSVIKVSGYPAGTTVSNVTVQLVNATGANGVFAQHLLVAPDGHNLDFLDSAWELSQPSSPITATMFDTAGQVPNGSQPPSSGNYEAFDNNQNGTVSFPTSSAPSIDTGIPQVPGTVNDAAPRGGTGALNFETAFSGSPANGDWVLYAFTDETESLNTGWCVTLDINTGVATTTTLTSSKNPQTTGQPVTLTATVKSSGNPVTSGGTVTFLDNGATPAGTSGGNNVVALNGSGQATFTTSSLTEGDHSFSADYSGTTTDNPSFGNLVQRIDDATTVTASASNVVQYCNAGPLTIAASQIGAFTPNPSNIFVTNLPGTINAVSLTLNNFSTASDQIFETESLIAGPVAAVDFFSNTGASNTVLSTGNYTFTDSAGGRVPQSAFGPGSYMPTAYNNVNSTADSFFSSTSGFYNTPSSFTYAAPRGTTTFANAFGETNANGTWSLFFNQLEKASAAGAANGWCLNFTENQPTLAVTKAHIGTFTQGQAGAQYSVGVVNDGPGSTGDPSGSFPLTVTDTLNAALTYAGFSGTGWSCSAVGQVVTCTNDASVAASSSYPTLVLNVNVSASATGNVTNSVSVSGAGAATTSSNVDSVAIEPAAVLAVTKSHSAAFVQGNTAQWQIAVLNTAAAASETFGTVNVSDTLPSGYTLNTYASTGSTWTCTGTTTIICTSTAAIAGGAESDITLTVNVPASSPTSVANTALAWGGGDLTHTSKGTAASGSDTASVTQVPATVVINNSGSPQSAAILTAFSIPLSVTVLDAGSVAIPGTNVIFTANAGLNGQSGVFSNSTGTITVGTSGTGIANAGTFTANNKVGSYTVTAAAGTVSNTFNLSNLTGAAAAITATGGSGQSTEIRTAFATQLAVTVTDAGSNPVPSVTVTFTAPTGATASGTFSNGTGVTTAVTDVNGVANAGAFTANSYPGGPYNVQATAGSLSTSLSLTNTGISQTVISSITPSSATIDVLGFGFGPPSGQLAFNDLTSGNPVSGPVTLNTANATAALATQTTSGTGTNTLPDWTTIADINGDGKPDLITSLYKTDSITVQLGNGDGTFQPASTILIAAGFGPAEAHLFSLRGNGVLDLVVGSFNTNQIAVLLGNGDGTFGTPAFITVGSAKNTPTSLTSGDFNHDSKLDIAVANTGDNTITILLGDGNGGLTVSGAPIAVGHDPEAIRDGDFNGDGFSDLAVANYQDGTVTTLVNNQNGTFTASTISVGSGHFSGPQALAITGSAATLKLAVANYKDGSVSVLPSNGDGTFGSQTITPVGNGPDDLSFADFNNDGIQDLVVANYKDGSVDLLIGSAGGTYTLVGPFPVGTAPYSAAVGDIDMDGTPDILVSNCFSNNTGTLLGGTRIAVPYTGLSLVPGDQLQAVYTPDGSSEYSQSSSPTVTAP